MQKGSAYSEWAGRLQAAEREFERDPSDIGLCDVLWDALDGGEGNNLKGISQAIRVYRSAAINSELGIGRLAAALKEVFETSGCLPSRDDLDPEILPILAALVEKSDSEEAKWLYITLNSG